MSLAEFSPQFRPLVVRYEEPVETEIARLVALLDTLPEIRTYPLRWLAVQLLEGDETLHAEVGAVRGGEAVLATVRESMAHLERVYGDDADVVLTEQRYGFVHQLTRSVLSRPAGQQVTVSDRVDRVLTHRFVGVAIFLALMWGVFKLTTDVAAPYVDWIDGVLGGPVAAWTSTLLSLLGLGGTWVESLLLDGVIAGVGGVLVFLPVLISLYLALAVLEDSGYMARAAFVMDRHMHALGLHGKSFLPMVIGFGCNVPAIYATRTLDTERDRTLTALLVPFMSCGARLPVYVLLAAVFFPAYGSLVVFGLYLLGIVVAIGLGMVLRHTLFQTQEQAPFIMELPPYRVPTLRNIWFHTWERTSAFIRHAGTMILAASLVVWLLTAIPTGGEGRFADTDIDDSAFALVARTAAPVFAPLGFGSWEASGALVSGVIAKEVVVSTMAQIYGVAAEEEGVETVGFIEGVGDIIGGFLTATVDTLKALPLMVGIDLSGGEEEAPSGGLLAAVRGSFEASSGGHGALAALAFMVFVLLYTPCMATVGALRHELGNRWMWFSVLGQFVVAWVGALIVFQVGLLLGVG